MCLGRYGRATRPIVRFYCSDKFSAGTFVARSVQTAMTSLKKQDLSFLNTYRFQVSDIHTDMLKVNPSPTGRLAGSSYTAIIARTIYCIAKKQGTNTNSLFRVRGHLARLFHLPHFDSLFISCTNLKPIPTNWREY